jgi:hypothetical protein
MILNGGIYRLSMRATLKIAEEIARSHFDGHLTIMRFTTHWKVMFGTPAHRDEIKRLPYFLTLREALEWLVGAWIEGRGANMP